MVIRKYQPSDCKELTELFYHTVHTINAKDYTKEQLDVWATGQVNLEEWNQRFQEHYSVVAEGNGVQTGLEISMKRDILTTYMSTQTIREKGLLRLFAGSWSRPFQEKLLPMLRLQQNLFSRKEVFRWFVSSR